MHQSVGFTLVLCALTAAAQDAPKPQYTARELFYSAASEPAPAAKAAPKSAAPAPQKAVTPKKPPVPPPAPVAAAAPPSAPAAQHTQPVALPGGGTIVKASMVSTAPAPDSGTPLGLKYTILKKSGDDMVEVPPDTVFHANDRIQIGIQTNGPGYLYIVLQGSSGTWTPMFPSPEVADGNNHVDGWNASVLPPGSRMVFDEQTGTENIFIVFSRTPEDGLENMIYSLQGRKVKPAADQEPKAPPKRMMQVASADIDNATVGRLRDTYTRDLVIEKVDDKTPADKSAAN